MSRGGRGGGRGGRSSGRGGVFATGSSLMGGLTYTEVMERSKDAASVKLFPEASLPDWQEPTQRELRSHGYMKSYLKKLRFSAYHVAIPEQKDVSHSKYSDRYEAPVDQLNTMASEEQKNRMGMEFFPTMIWQAFYNKKSRVLRRRKILKKKPGQVLGTDDNADDDAEGKEGEERGSGDEDEEEPDEFDDEEENPDYDNNYFDDGADDQDDDGGGGDGEGTYD